MTDMLGDGNSYSWAVSKEDKDYSRLMSKKQCVSHRYENVSSTKFGHDSQTTRETTGGRCAIIKRVPRSDSLLALLVAYSDKRLQSRVVQ